MEMIGTLIMFSLNANWYLCIVPTVDMIVISSNIKMSVNIQSSYSMK